MSKKDETDETKETELPAEEQHVADEPAQDEEPDVGDPIVESTPEPAAATVPEVVSPAAPRKGTGGIAWLALFLSLITLAAVGYMLVQDWRAQREANQSGTSLADLADRMASSGDSLAKLDRDLANLAAADAQAAADLERLQSDVDNRIQLLDSLP